MTNDASKDHVTRLDGIDLIRIENSGQRLSVKPIDAAPAEITGTIGEQFRKGPAIILRDVEGELRIPIGFGYELRQRGGAHKRESIIAETAAQSAAVPAPPVEHLREPEDLMRLFHWSTTPTELDYFLGSFASDNPWVQEYHRHLAQADQLIQIIDRGIKAQDAGDRHKRAAQKVTTAISTSEEVRERRPELWDGVRNALTKKDLYPTALAVRNYRLRNEATSSAFQAELSEVDRELREIMEQERREDAWDDTVVTYAIVGGAAAGTILGACTTRNAALTVVGGIAGAAIGGLMTASAIDSKVRRSRRLEQMTRQLSALKGIRESSARYKREAMYQRVIDDLVTVINEDPDLESRLQRATTQQERERVYERAKYRVKRLYQGEHDKQLHAHAAPAGLPSFDWAGLSQRFQQAFLAGDAAGVFGHMLEIAENRNVVFRKSGTAFSARVDKVVGGFAAGAIAAPGEADEWLFI